MERHFMAKATKIQLFAMIAIFLQACGVVNTASPSKSCSTGQAIIQVYDGFVQRTCGCQEGTGSFTTGLQCTIPHGTSVYFYYPGITVPHQIYISSQPSPLNYRDPNTGASSGFVDVVQLNSTGSVTFTDSSTGNGGTFTVQ
jgi:hypothetical protein